MTAPIPRTASDGQDHVRAFEEGVGHYQAGRAREAGEAFERARSQEPSSAATWLYLGLLALNEDARDRAFELLSTARELDPSLAPAWHYLGVILERNGDIDGARDCYSTALNIDPNATLSRQAMEHLGPQAQDPGPDVAEPGRNTEARPLGEDRPGDVSLSSVYGVYEVLSQSSDPLVRQPLPLMDQVHRDCHARVSAFIYRFVAGAAAGFLLAYVVAQGRQSAEYWGSTSDTRTASTSSVVLLTVVFGGAIVAWLVLVAASTRYIISRGRIQVVSGVLVRRHTNLELYRAIDITYTRNVAQRLTGDGTLVVETATHKLRLIGVAPTSQLRVLYQQLLNLVFALRANNYVRGIIS